MKNKITVLLLAVLMLTAVFPFSAFSQNERVSLYVAADGSDSADGSIEAPFASIERAKEEIRRIKSETGLPDGGICVYLRGGTYNLKNGVNFKAEDSGTKESPITYRAYPNEEVVVLGGIKLDGADFTKVTDSAVLSKITDEKARDKIYSLDLTKYGIMSIDPMPHYGVFQFAISSKDSYDVDTISGRAMELFVNDKAKTTARWPNGGEMATFQMEDVANPKECFSAHAKINYKNDRINKWLLEDDYHLYGYWTRQWADWSVEIASYDGKTMELNAPFTYTLEQGTRSWYAYNLFCELDEAGEYYMDRKTNTLYYYPEENLRTADIYVSTFPDALFKLECDYVHIKDMKLTAARGAGVQMFGRGNKVERCEISNTAYQGVEISGYENGVSSCYLHDVNSGVLLFGGDRKTLTPGGNYVENTEITRFCRITLPNTPAIRIQGVGNRVSHCRLHDAEQIALMFYGNDHIMEYNNIYNVCQKADDVSAVYSGKDLSFRGNRFENNWVHDIYKGIGIMGCSGLYLDDQMSSAIVKNNVFENIEGRGVQIEGGRNHDIENNIMINCSMAVMLNNRKTGVKYWEMDSSDGDYWAVESILAVPYNTGIWAEKYPELTNILDPSEDMGAPRYNTIADNVMINCGDMKIYSVAEQYGTIKDNKFYKRLSDAFTNETKGEYVLKAEENTNNFPSLNINNTGVYVDDFYKAIDKNVVLCVGNAGAIADNSLKMIDDGNISAVPFIENGRTFVPLRFVAENLGAEVSWNPDEQKVGISMDGKSVSMRIGENSFTADDKTVETDSAPCLIDGRTYVPIRAVSEAFLKNVFWDDSGLIIIGDNEPSFSDVTKKIIINELTAQTNLR